MDVGEDSVSSGLKFDTFSPVNAARTVAMKEYIFAPVSPGRQDTINDPMIGACDDTNARFDEVKMTL